MVLLAITQTGYYLRSASLNLAFLLLKKAILAFKIFSIFKFLHVLTLSFNEVIFDPDNFIVSSCVLINH